ncbi:hypothetical protein BDC45DRAFT_573478 [Circinella umbellata]|nr:hypothetical protein BDC45DRAFT_573478 [Circinella umbellata]
MWSGTNIYAKAERYLIRILLRVFYLEREQRTMVRTKATTQKTKKEKQQQSSTSQPQSLSNKQIMFKIQHERQHLAKHIQSTPTFAPPACANLPFCTVVFGNEKSGSGTKAEKNKTLTVLQATLDLIFSQTRRSFRREPVAPATEEKVKEASATRIRKLEGIYKF